MDFQKKRRKKMCLGTIKGNIKEYDPKNVINPFDNTRNALSGKSI